LLLARRWLTHSDIVGLADRYLLGGRRHADGNLSRGFRRCRRLAHSDLGVRLSFDVLRRARVTSSAFCTVSSRALAGSPIAVSLRLFSSSMAVPPNA
jgi:hypothetical protein